MNVLFALLGRLARLAHDTVETALEAPFTLLNHLAAAAACAFQAAAGGAIAAVVVLILFKSPVGAAATGVVWAGASAAFALLKFVHARYGPRGE